MTSLIFILQLAGTTPSIATQSFLLSNMFDPATETMPDWEFEIRDDVIDECNKQGGILHIYVDKTSAQGNVYVKCTSVNAAVAAVNSLHGRWFAGLSFNLFQYFFVPVKGFSRTIDCNNIVLQWRRLRPHFETISCFESDSIFVYWFAGSSFNLS